MTDSSGLNAASVEVRGVSKKFCRRLRRALWYGFRDLCSEVAGRTRPRDTLRRDEFFAVDRLSFDLEPGQCLGLIGANGAGKSTLLKMLNGLLRPDAGQVRLRGRVEAMIELGSGFSPVLTGRENVYVNGAMLGLSKREIEHRLEEILSFAAIGDAIDRALQTYSSGMRVRLAMGIAVALRPKILLVDEVLAVGDTAFRMKCYDYFLGLKQRGTTIVLVSHSMLDVTRVCDRVVLLERGSVAFDGEVNQGILLYEESMLRQHLIASGADPAAAARIERVELVDADGQPRSDYHTGDTLEGIVTLCSRSVIPRARIVVHVITPALGSVGSFSSPHHGFTFDVTPPVTRVRFTVRDLPLLRGSYALTFWLYGEEIKDYHAVLDRAVTFRVVGPAVDPFGYGVSGTVHFEHGWEELGARREANT